MGGGSRMGGGRSQSDGSLVLPPAMYSETHYIKYEYQQNTNYHEVLLLQTPLPTVASAIFPSSPFVINSDCAFKN